MIVIGYRTYFRRDQQDVSDSVRLVLSRLTPAFTINMPTLQPREEMALSVGAYAPYVNYISIEYDAEQEPQKFRQVWYYFAEFDPASPSTPANTAFRLYADWWAMSIDWYGEDTVGIQIKRGELVHSHAFITGTDAMKAGTSLAAKALNPRALGTVTRPQAQYPGRIAIVALYHVNGSIFSIPGTDKYLQVIVPISGDRGTPATQADATRALYLLSNGKSVTYSVPYTDEEGKAQTFTETPDISECVGLWVLPHWVLGDMITNSPSSLSSASVYCYTAQATSVVVPIGIGTSKTYEAWAVVGDYAATKTLTVPGNLLKYRYFGNPGANIVLPQTLESVTAQVLIRFSIAQQSFSVKFAAVGSIIDATNSLAVNVNSENYQLQVRNDVIKGGISAITAAIGAAVAGAAGAGVGLLATGSNVINTAAAGVGLANSSRYAEGMDGVNNMVALDYSTGASKYVYGCALVEYDADNANEVRDSYDENGATGSADVVEVGRVSDHPYMYYRLDNLIVGHETSNCEPARQEIQRLLSSGVRIWNDIQSTKYLTVKSWQ